MSTTPDAPAIQGGDEVFISLVNGSAVFGTLLKAMSGEGQTDGLLKIDQSGDVVFVYERHVMTIRKKVS